MNIIILLAFVYSLYSYAIFTNNDFIGDILSTVVMLIILVYVFYIFVFKQKNKSQRGFVICLSLSIFAWFICDLWWGIQTLILHTNPEESFVTVYGYSFTNLFIFCAIIFSGYQDLKRMNMDSKDLEKLDTKDGHYYLGIVYYNMKKFDLAKEEILKAKSLGANYDNMDAILKSIK